MARVSRRPYILPYAQSGNRLVSQLRKVRELHIPVKRVVLAGTFLFALLVSLPLTWGVRPLPYYVGFVSPADIPGRVDFEWSDPEAEKKAVAELERRHVRVYREEIKWSWMNEVLTPVVNLLEKAVESKNPKTILTFAQEEKISLSAEQAQRLVDALGAEKEGFRLYRDVVEPMRGILDNRVFTRGILQDDRFAAETSAGGDILILTPQGDQRRVSLVGRGREQPLPIAQVLPMLREWFRYEMWVGRSLQEALCDILRPRVRATLTFDEASTKQSLELLTRETLERLRQIRTGQVLVRRGEPLTLPGLRRLETENRTYRIAQGWNVILLRFLGKSLLTLAAMFGCVIVLGMLEKTEPRVLIGAALGMGLVLLLAHAANAYHLPILQAMLPVGLVAGFGALAWGRSAATTVVTVLALLLLVVFEGKVSLAVSFLAGSCLYIYAIPAVRERWGILRLALIGGLAAMAVTVLWGLASGEPLKNPLEVDWASVVWSGDSLLARGVWNVAGWFVSGVALLFLLPLVEKVYRQTTRIRLSELQDQDHPCLRQLLMEAPNTYHHCAIVGTLAEAGAAAIGADAMLARVGSYYHDIGKIMKPQYFSENETGFSRHDHLNPAMSTLIIISHVKDGLEMGREFRLPPGILDMIAQHHGRSIVRYFYQRAQKQAGEGEKVQEEAFRYPGPKPQSREAGVLMLADSVEAASRSLDNPTQGSLRKLVHEICIGRVLDGQLDESGLTLTDIRRVEDAFVAVLGSMFHSRVKYPKAREGMPRPR